jgi:hypothetical protein
MTEQEQAKFEGWAIVDVLGHQRYVGYVRTETYGQAVMFRVDVPELPEREYELPSPAYVEVGRGSQQWCPVGTKVKRPATAGYTKLIGAGSIYSISPCDEKAAMVAVEAAQRPAIKLISLPENQKALAAGREEQGFEPDDEDSDLSQPDDAVRVPY